jgi:hypothetical protein
VIGLRVWSEKDPESGPSVKNRTLNAAFAAILRHGVCIADAVPTLLVKDGFRFHFYSNEGAELPHVHVTGADGEMKIWLQSLVVEFSYGLSPTRRRRAQELTAEFSDLFLEKWNEFARKKN